MLGLLCFIAVPVIFAFMISFMKWDIGSTPEWSGVDNYRKMMSDPTFWKVLKNTFVFVALTVPTMVAGSLLLALMLNSGLRGRTLFRAAYFIPAVTSSVAVALIWTWLYNPNYGLINASLNALGLQGPGWLTDMKWALPSVAIMYVWQGLGYNMVLFLAGLQGVPSHLYEAAKIDGAGSWQRFWRITLPMISPTTFFVVIMLLIGTLQVFSEPYMMTRGGPADATNVMVLHIFNTAFQFYRMGEASAISFVLFLIILCVTYIQFRYSKWVNYDV